MLPSHCGLDHRGDGEERRAVLAEGDEQRAVLELADHDGPHPYALEPLLQRASHGGVVGRQEHRGPVE